MSTMSDDFKALLESNKKPKNEAPNNTNVIIIVVGTIIIVILIILIVVISNKSNETTGNSIDNGFTKESNALVPSDGKIYVNSVPFLPGEIAMGMSKYLPAIKS
jgi:flagellar basal body-associated protein FliL